MEGLETTAWQFFAGSQAVKYWTWAWGYFWTPFPGCADRQFGLISSTVITITEMIGFLLSGDRTCPRELGRDRSQEDHRRWEGNS